MQQFHKNVNPFVLTKHRSTCSKAPHEGDHCRVISLGTTGTTFQNTIKNQSPNRNKLNRFTLLLSCYFAKTLTIDFSGGRPEGVWGWHQCYTGSPYLPIFSLMPQTGKERTFLLLHFSKRKFATGFRQKFLIFSLDFGKLNPLDNLRLSKSRPQILMIPSVYPGKPKKGFQIEHL